MVSMKISYQGEKHCDLNHGPSGVVISTDAPKDNNGKGEAFSPTDLTSASLGACMLTVMAISAEKDGVNLKGATCVIEKEMVANPRRIGKLTARLQMPAALPQDYRRKMEVIADTCPVRKSLHPEIQIDLHFEYSL